MDERNELADWTPSLLCFMNVSFYFIRFTVILRTFQFLQKVLSKLVDSHNSAFVSGKRVYGRQKQGHALAN